MLEIDLELLTDCLFNESNDALIIFDPATYEILEVNPVTQKLTNWRRKELLRRKLSDVIQASDNTLMGELQAACQETQFFHGKEGYMLVGANGVLLDISLSVSRLHRAERTLGLAVIRDTSDRKQLAELQQQLGRLARLTTIGELAAGIAHEVTQPASAIVNFVATCEAIIADDSSPKAQELKGVLSEVQFAARQIGEIVQRLRSFVIGASPQRTLCCIRKLIQDVLSMMRAELRRRKIRVVMHVGENVTVLADPIQLQQVFVNLVVNACDAIDSTGRDRGTIWIECTEKDGALILSFEDSGIGLPSVGPERIFDPFFTTKNQGLGTGLTISRKIIEAHNGTISASTSERGGAEFRITLPI